MEEKKSTPRRLWFLCTCVAVLGIIAILVSGSFRPKTDYLFPTGADIDPVATEAEFMETQDNDTLYRLVLSLCYRDKRDPDGAYREKLRQYGSLLYDRAKAQKLDLETIDQPEIVEQVLIYLSSDGFLS